MRHRVSFRWGGSIKFGHVELGAEAKQAAAVGELLIREATRAKRYQVKDDAQVKDFPYSFSRFDEPPTNDFDAHVRQEWEKVKAQSKAAGKGLKPGKLLSIPVADGEAYYVVTKVSKNAVTLEWRCFNDDGYRDIHFGFGGNFPKQMVENIVRMCDFQDSLFGGV